MTAKILIVEYVDGREDVYPICEGSSVLGSAPDCSYSIQADGLMPQHLAFSEQNGEINVSNLQAPETVTVNGVPLEQRMPFDIGDELRVGSISICLRLSAAEGPDVATTPDGIREVAESARRDFSAGWLGYRKILAKLTPFVAPDEAEEAQTLHKAGVRALSWCLVLLLGLASIGWFADAHARFGVAAFVFCLAFYAALVSTLILTAVHRLRFSGRILFPAIALIDNFYPPDVSWIDYFDFKGDFTVGATATMFLFGWLFDIGASCVLQETRRRCASRYAVLNAATIAFVVKIGIAYAIFQPEFASIWWYIPSLLVAIIFPWILRWFLRRGEKKRNDVLFVAELASIRMGRAWMAHAMAVLSVAAPLFFVLSALGMRDRICWKEGDSSLVVTQNLNGVWRAWYWEDRGLFLSRSIFDKSFIFQIPYAELTRTGDQITLSEDEEGISHQNESEATHPGGDVPETERSIMDDLVNHIKDFKSETSLGDRGIAEGGNHVDEPILLNNFALSLCHMISDVRQEPMRGEAYNKLKDALAPYRVRSENVDLFVEHHSGVVDAETFFLEEMAVRRTPDSIEGSSFHHAQLGIGLKPYSQEDARHQLSVNGSLILPCLVLLTFGTLFLWKRGGDSAVGRWLGIAMVMNAQSMFFINNELPFDASAKYLLWHEALKSPLGSILAGWFGFFLSSGFFLLCIALLAQSILFVLLCWPRPPESGGDGLHKALVFAGKFFVALLLGSFSGLVAVIIQHLLGLDGLFPIGPRLAAIFALSVLGAFMRRTRRVLTEAPSLGWEFVAGWIFLELSILLPQSIEATKNPLITSSWLNPLPWLGNITSGMELVSGVCALAGGFLFLRLCLRRNFLSVMSVNGLAFTMLAFLIPIFSEICESLVEDAFHESFLQSENGEKVLSIAVIVLVLGPTWDVLQSLSKRFSVRNLVRIEDGIESTLEIILDDSGDFDVRDEIYEQLRQLGVEQYAFYARTNENEFSLILKNGWQGTSADSFRMSPFLRRYLGRHPQVIEIDHVSHEHDLFFQSFELYKIGSRLHASCLMPICLGTSVRGVIVTPEVAKNMTFHSNDVFWGNVNSLGLATVVSAKEHKR